jgi:hypothetical protein
VAVQAAREAMWQTFAAKYPEVTTGDLAPGADHDFIRECDKGPRRLAPTTTGRRHAPRRNTSPPPTPPIAASTGCPGEPGQPSPAAPACIMSSTIESSASGYRAARDLPAPDPAAFLAQNLATAPYRYAARITVHAPADVVRARTGALPDRVEPLDENTCTVHVSDDSLDRMTQHLVALGADFTLDTAPTPCPRRTRTRSSNGGRPNIPSTLATPSPATIGSIL